MSRPVASPASAEVRAVPIGQTLVALWAVLAKSCDGVNITLEDASATLWKKRRVIGSTHRIHLFIFQVADVRRLGKCTLTYRERRGAAVMVTTVLPRAPEWRATGTGPAIRAIVAALEEAEALAGALAQTLSAISAWVVPCRFSGVEGGISLSVLEFAPRVERELTVLALENGHISERSPRAVNLGSNSTSLLWRGDAPDRAYVERDGDLVELALTPPRETDGLSLAAWFAEQSPEQRDRLLDAWSELDDINDLPILGQIAASRSFAAGNARLAVDAAFAIGDSRILLLTRSAGLAGPDHMEATPPGGPPVRFVRMALAAQQGGPETDATHFHEARLPGGAGDVQALRLTVALAGVVQSGWIRVQPLSSYESYRKILARIAWESADQEFVDSFARAIASGTVPPLSTGPTPPLIRLSGARGRGALVVTAFPGDETALKATLLFVRLSLAEATVRLVHRGRLSASEQVALRSVCCDFEGHVELVMTDAPDPIGLGLGLRPEDHERPACIFVESGVVPVDVDWWVRIGRAIRHQPTAIHWCSQSMEDGAADAAGSMGGGAPLLVAGPMVDPALLRPRLDVFSFAGFVRRTMIESDRKHSLRSLGEIHLVRFAGDANTGSGYGDLRLDDAVIASILAAERAQQQALEPMLMVVGQSRSAGG